MAAQDLRILAQSLHLALFQVSHGNSTLQRKRAAMSQHSFSRKRPEIYSNWTSFRDMPTCICQGPRELELIGRATGVVKK